MSPDGLLYDSLNKRALRHKIGWCVRMFFAIGFIQWLMAYMNGHRERGIKREVLEPDPHVPEGGVRKRQLNKPLVEHHLK